jgi:GT2 family glycosyltransferase
MRQAAGADITVGVIITNRDRVAPMDACLASISVQEKSPTWVLVSDLGSAPECAAALRAFADRYAVSYLRVEHNGQWNKGLAFNTALRAALRRLPRPSHVIQLDADMILHPRLVTTTVDTLREVDAMYCAPRNAPAGVTWRPEAGIDGYRHMIEQCGPVVELASGPFMVLPVDWLERERGFDESFVGWGHEDADMWWRVRRGLSFTRDLSGTMLVHQWHHRQPGADRQGTNWPKLMHRIGNPDTEVNLAGWGEGQISWEIMRPGMTRTPLPQPVSGRVRRLIVG